MTRRFLYATTRAGSMVEDVRHWRVEVAGDGSLVVHEPGASRRVVAAPGQIDRVVVVSSPDVGRRLLPRLRRASIGWEVLVFLGDDDVALSVPLRDVRLGQHDVENDADMRATSGAADVALGLGLTLESATSRDVARANSDPRALTRGAIADTFRRARRRHLLAAAWVVAAFIALGTSGYGYEGAAVAMFVSFPALAMLCAETWRRTSDFLAHTAPPTADRRLVPNVAGPDRWLWLRQWQLQIGPHDIVHVEHARETWLPGPSRGGVVRCTVSDDTIRFYDRHDVILTALPAELWVLPGTAPTALQAACSRAGIELERLQGEDIPPFVAANLDPTVYASPQALTLSLPVLERASLFLASGLFVAAMSGASSLIALATAATIVDLAAPWRAIAATAASVHLVVFATTIVMYRRMKRWDQHQMSVGTHEETTP